MFYVDLTRIIHTQLMRVYNELFFGTLTELYVDLYADLNADMGLLSDCGSLMRILPGSFIRTLCGSTMNYL